MLAANPHIELHITRYGGHCGFVGPRRGDDDGYWAEGQIVDFVARAHQTPPRDPANETEEGELLVGASR